MPPLSIRPAAPADVTLLLEMIGELADYERLSEALEGNQELLNTHLFGPQPAAEARIALLGAHPAGFTIYYPTFSTFLCRPGIWLEDIFVRAAHRRAGVGRALLADLAAVAVERGCGRLEWSALDWNERALRLYAAVGATRMDEWTAQRLEGDALRRLAAQSAL